MVLFQAASVRPLGTGCHTGIGTGGVRTPALSGAGTSRGGARMSGTGAAGKDGEAAPEVPRKQS